MNVLLISDLLVRVDHAGRLNLNDLHKAAGGQRKNRPSLWLASQQTQAFVADLDAEAGHPPVAIQRGSMHPGTYARREAALAYAAWITPAFLVQVVRATEERQLYAALNDPPTLQSLLRDYEARHERNQRKIDRLEARAAARDRLRSESNVVWLRPAGRTVETIPGGIFYGWLYAMKLTYRSMEARLRLGHAGYREADYLQHSLAIGYEFRCLLRPRIGCTWRRWRTTSRRLGLRCLPSQKKLLDPANISYPAFEDPDNELDLH